MVHSKLLLSLSTLLAVGALSAVASSNPTLGATVTTVTIGASCSTSQTLQIASSGGSASPIAFNVSVNYPNGTSSGDTNGNWLFAMITGSGVTSTGASFQSSTGASDSGVSLTIGLNRSIGPVVDTGQVIVTEVGNPSDTITISVSYLQSAGCGGNTGSANNGFISVTPGNLALTASANGQQSIGISIQNTTTTGMTFGFGVAPAGSWLSASASTTAISANGTVEMTVTADAAKTAGPGSYNGILVITPQSGFGPAINIPVTFVVAGSGASGSGKLTINGATSTSYTTTFSYVAPTIPGAQCIPIQDSAPGANSYTTQVTTSSGGSWLLANNQISATVVQLLAPQYAACVNLGLSSVASSLTSGAYQGSVLITSSSGSQATIYVNLYVSDGLTPGITVTGAIFSFGNVPANSTIIQQQAFVVAASQGYILGTVALTNSANGFSISSPVVSNNTGIFTITSNSAGLTAGMYSTTVTITSSLNNSTNASTITVVLPVGQDATTPTGGGGGTVAPTALAFQQQQGSTFWTGGKEAQQITFTGVPGTSWSASIVYAGGASNWLNLVSGTSGTFGNGPATLSVDLFNGVTGLNASSTPYQATLMIQTTSGSYPVAVSLTVTPPNTPVLLGLPASSTFNTAAGTNPADQVLRIVGSDDPSSNISPPIAAGTPSAPWLSATTSGNMMTVSVNANDQTSGVYSATIPVTAVAYSNPINYPVVLVVNGGTANGLLTLSSSSLFYNNVTAQTSQNLGVTASSATAFTTATSETTCINQNWLSISNGSSFIATTSGINVQVSVTPAGIGSGTSCSGVVSLITASATQQVYVTMTVNATNGDVAVGATFLAFNCTQGQTVPVAKYVTVINTISGAGSIPFTVTSSETSGASVNWLQVDAASGSTPMNSPGLAVSVAPGSLSAGQYSGTVTITPNGGTPRIVNITLNVGSAPPVGIAVTHTGNFVQGQTGASYAVTVSTGASSVPDSQFVAVQVVPPTGLALASLGGSGWACLGNDCYRSNSLPAGSNYPVITATVNVANNAAPLITNQVGLLYNGSLAAQASDPTSVLSPCALTHDAAAGVPDVQQAINEALGVKQAVDDLNRDGAVNTSDVQAVIAAARGVGCFVASH